MKKDWKYIAYIAVAILVYLLVKLTAPREYDWTISYHHNDKNPFGAYALHQLGSSIYGDERFTAVNSTPYEIYDSLNAPANFISISTSFKPGETDLQAILKNVEAGGHALIAAQYFPGGIGDSLGVSTFDYFFEKDNFGYFSEDDSSGLYFTNGWLDQGKSYVYSRKNIHNYFDSFDSTRMRVIAVNDLDLPVMLRIPHGKGAIILCSTPLIFTNAYLLQGDNAGFIEQSLSLLPSRNTFWTDYYQIGKLQIQSPLRFILSTEPLRWAYYIIIISLLIFILFEVKRKQRIIPVIKPLENTTVEFVGTIGNLYYQAKDHKGIAEKRIAFLLEQLRTRYGFSFQHATEESINTLARRTGNDVSKVNELIRAIREVQSMKTLSEAALEYINKKIESFTY